MNKYVRIFIEALEEAARRPQKAEWGESAAVWRSFKGALGNDDRQESRPGLCAVLQMYKIPWKGSTRFNSLSYVQNPQPATVVL